MRVICPKCQFENQADSSRVVCARCATIIDVKPDAGMSYDSYNTNFADPGYRDAGYSDSGYGGGSFDSGRQGTMSTNYAGNYAGGNYPSGSYGGGNYPSANYPTAPVSRSGDHDVYATRIDDDDFGDVLDLPRNAPPQQQGYQIDETTPVYEDVFSTPEYGMPKDQRNTADPYRGGMADPYRSGNYNEQGFDNPSYGVPPEPEFMGWPVLPEDSTDPGISNVGSYNKKNSRFKTLLIVLGVALAGLFLYNFLSGPVTKRTATRRPDANESAATGGATNPTDAGSTGATDTSKNTPPVTVPPSSGEKLPIGVVGPAPVSGSDAAQSKPSTSQVVIPPVTGSGNSGRVLQPDKITVKPPPATSKETAVTKQPSGVEATPNRGNITIQVGSFPDQAQATERVSRLQSAGVTARTVAATVQGRTWYRVQVGKFASREQAASYASQMRGKGLIQESMVTPIK